MNAVPVFDSSHQSQGTCAVISGPLSHLSNCGAPRSVISRSSLADAVSIDRALDQYHERLARELIRDVEQLQRPPVGGLVELEVERRCSGRQTPAGAAGRARLLRSRGSRGPRSRVRTGRPTRAPRDLDEAEREARGTRRTSRMRRCSDCFSHRLGRCSRWRVPGVRQLRPALCRAGWTLIPASG